jgi:hypothetical protein
MSKGLAALKNMLQTIAAMVLLILAELCYIIDHCIHMALAVVCIIFVLLIMTLATAMMVAPVAAIVCLFLKI